MKKSIIKISLAFGIIAVPLLILLGLRSIDGGGTAPSYRFLGGQKPVSFKKAKKGTEDSRGIEDRRYIYSFEADFNDICSKADAELIPSGFRSTTRVGQTFFGTEYSIRNYWQKGRFPRGSVWIYIYSQEQYLEIPISNKDATGEKTDFNMVEIVYYQGWRWPF